MLHTHDDNEKAAAIDWYELPPNPGLLLDPRLAERREKM